MKVTHLYHSGCLVELNNHLLLFDYYQGELHLNQEKPLYVFVSHRHYDHYNPNIFKIHHPQITYIISNTLRHKYDAYYVDIHQTYQIDDLSISTLLSTDEGCAFLVHVENQTIYHAGDLHWWHWEGEPEQDNIYQKQTYLQEICSIKEPVDLACVVVDIRQEKDYLLGLNAFFKTSSYKIHFTNSLFWTLRNNKTPITRAFRQSLSCSNPACYPSKSDI